MLKHCVSNVLSSKIKQSFLGEISEFFNEYDFLTCKEDMEALHNMLSLISVKYI